MKDIDILKNLNIWEKIGFYIKKNPKKAITIVSSFIAILIFIAFIPTIVFSIQKNTANKYLDETNNKLEEYSNSLSSSRDTLNNNQHIYKDYTIYSSQLDSYDSEHVTLVGSFKGYEKEFENKNIEHILKNFSYYKDKSKTRVIFPNIVKESFDKFILVRNDIYEIYDLDTKLISNTINFDTYLKDVESDQNKRYKNLDKVSINGKNNRIKEKSNNLFNIINNSKLDYVSTYEKTTKFIKDDQGNFNLQELRGINKEHNILHGIFDNFKDNLSNFDNYYRELTNQYYTIVISQNHDKTTDYITESNPSYREWTETETYQENYTEREYKGSRIVNGNQEDIYETVTKTRPATRTVTKNNGQPRTIQVAYSVYNYYYMIEKHTPDGVTKTKEYVGKKHEKYDYSIRTWNYNSEEEIGYIVWKQLWNDNEGILRGKNVKAHLE